MKNIRLLPILLCALLFGQYAYATPLVPGGETSVAIKPDLVTNDFLHLDSNGYLEVNVETGGGSGGGTSSLFGAAFPTSGTAIGLSNGTNMLSATAFSNATSGIATSSSNLGTAAFNYAFNGTTWDQVMDATSPPSETTQGMVVRQVPQNTFRTTFGKVLTNAVDTNFFTIIQTGTGMAVNQTGGNLVITSGTTANSETVLRSVSSFTNAFNLREQTTLSQRIANNNFYVELVDVIGDALTYSITNATTVVVTIPSNPFTSANVGQSMYLGVVSGAAGIPQKATIASVSGNNVTYTVTGWPASGSGTLSVFGWNYHHILYTSTTATNANYDAQGNGWPTGDTVATINTTAAPGHVAQMFYDDGMGLFSDSLIASTLTPAFTVRASRFSNIPSATTPLFVQLHVLNGTTAPASTTTWTVGFLSVQTFASSPVSIQTGKLLGAASLGVNVQNVPAVTVNSGTITTVSTAAILSGGPTAAGSASANNPNQIGLVDSDSLVRKVLGSAIGEVQDFGPGESVTPFTVGTGAAAVTDGTNGKTINLLSGKEGDVYLYVDAISTTPTIQVEISYANSGDYAVIPMTRVDNTAASQQFASVAAFTPVAGAVYRGKTYGAAILRVHLVAGSASNTIGTVRVQYQQEMAGVLVSPFAFQSSGTVEAVGSANGQVYTGSVRTLTVPIKGSTVATVVFEANTGGSNIVALEGSQDYGTTWNALPMQPLAGGATVTSFTNTGTAALPGSGIYQVDVSNQTQIRAHCTTYASGAVYGYIKLVNVDSPLAANPRHPTYTASVSGSVTATTNVLAIISGSAKTVTIKRIVVNGGTATAATLGTLTFVRGSVAAPAGGTAVTAATLQHNPADAAFSGSVLQGISSAITVVGLTAVNTATSIPVPVETSTLGIPGSVVYDCTNGGSIEGYQIPVATTNSMLLSFTGTSGGANFSITVDFTEE
jgi:hypothetical protein